MAEDSQNEAEWLQYTKGVKPLAKGKKHVAMPQHKPIIVNPPQISRAEAQTLNKATIWQEQPSAISSSEGIAAAQARKMDKGQIPLDAVLDLHGLPLVEALENFINFINSAYMRHQRMLLVITGKGKSSESGQGKIRQALPQWINLPQLAGKILRYNHATAQHGGSGAFYILLRKNHALATK